MVNFSEKINNIFLRYFLIVLFAIPNLLIFYIVFAPLTVYPVYFILNIFFDTVLYQNIIIVAHEIPIELIDACIAASAYYLLFVLNMSIPNIKIKKRLKMIAFSFVVLLSINLIRIILLSFLYINDSVFFDFTHKLFWYLGNLVFVVAIWFTEVKLYNIKEIPFYSDLKFFFTLRKKTYKSNSSKKNNRA